MKSRVLISIGALLFLNCFSAWAQDLPPEWASERDAAMRAFSDGNLEESESKWRSALKMADQARAVEPGVVTCLVGLCRVYDKKGDAREAERLYELAMRNMEALVGPNGVRFADFMPELAFIYEAHGNPEKGELLFKRALEIKKSAYGANDVRVAEVLEQYAHFLRVCKCGRSTEAGNLENEARVIRMKQSS